MVFWLTLVDQSQEPVAHPYHKTLYYDVDPFLFYVVRR